MASLACVVAESSADYALAPALGAAVLATPAIVRAAPASANFAFFVSTSPFMIAKGDGSIKTNLAPHATVMYRIGQ